MVQIKVYIRAAANLMNSFYVKYQKIVRTVRHIYLTRHIPMQIHPLPPKNIYFTTTLEKLEPANHFLPMD